MQIAYMDAMLSIEESSVPPMSSCVRFQKPESSPAGPAVLVSPTTCSSPRPSKDSSASATNCSRLKSFAP